MMNTISQRKTTMQPAFAIAAIVFAAASSLLHAEQNLTNPSVSNVWVRTTVPGSTVSAAYMQIKSAVPLKLVKAESAVAGIVEIHDMKMHDGVMEMKALDALDVPAGKNIELKPGGTHIMLMGVKKPINKGDKVLLTLTFARVDKTPVVVKIEATAHENKSSVLQH